MRTWVLYKKENLLKNEITFGIDVWQGIITDFIDRTLNMDAEGFIKRIEPAESPEGLVALLQAEGLEFFPGSHDLFMTAQATSIPSENYVELPLGGGEFMRFIRKYREVLAPSTYD